MCKHEGLQGGKEVGLISVLRSKDGRRWGLIGKLCNDLKEEEEIIHVNAFYMLMAMIYTCTWE